MVTPARSGVGAPIPSGPRIVEESVPKPSRHTAPSSGPSSRLAPNEHSAPSGHPSTSTSASKLVKIRLGRAVVGRDGVACAGRGAIEGTGTAGIPQPPCCLLFTLSPLTPPHPPPAPLPRLPPSRSSPSWRSAHAAVLTADGSVLSRLLLPSWPRARAAWAVGAGRGGVGACARTGRRRLGRSPEDEWLGTPRHAEAAREHVPEALFHGTRASRLQLGPSTRLGFLYGPCPLGSSDLIRRPRRVPPRTGTSDPSSLAGLPRARTIRDRYPGPSPAWDGWRSLGPGAPPRSQPCRRLSYPRAS